MFQVDNLRYKYPKNKEDTLKGLSFSIKEGEIFGLLGPSGVGKSTTQKILIKLLTGYQGTVLYKGRSLAEYGREFYQEVGVGFEMPVHFAKLTARENIAFFQGLYKSKIDASILMEELGLQEDWDKSVATFSKGMKIRLNFVRAMLNDPKMLFLDEPTNGLDPKNAMVIKNLILDFQKKGGTVLLTTHLMGDAEALCQRVAFMSEGEIKELDSPKNLKLKGGKRLLHVEYEDQGIQERSFPLEDIGKNEEFFALMRDKPIVTVHSSETSLEDLFIQIVGGNRQHG